MCDLMYTKYQQFSFAGFGAIFSSTFLIGLDFTWFYNKQSMINMLVQLDL